MDETSQDVLTNGNDATLKQTIMTNQLAQLNKLAETLDLNQFYTISFSDHEIRPQGNFDNNLVRQLKKLGYEVKVQDHGFVHCSLGNVTIVLT